MSVETVDDRVTLVRLADSPSFSHDLDELAPGLGTTRVVLDFTDARHINSSGLAGLLRLRQRLVRDDGRLVLFGLSPQVTSVFQVTGLDNVFNLAADRDRAIEFARS
jgi:anti-anti-sigma factor